MDAQGLRSILASHKSWLSNTGGSRANLSGADLSWADLSGADLSGASLSGADLSWANLSGANLSGADLSWANLSRANLKNTCIDQDNLPNAHTDLFTPFLGDPRYVVGYRTRKAGHIDVYRDGRHYNADWFSTSDTPCHPGLYLWPTPGMAHDFSGDSTEMIRVKAKKTDIHQAGNKWRCREFYVLGSIGSKKC